LPTNTRRPTTEPPQVTDTLAPTNTLAFTLTATRTATRTLTPSRTASPTRTPSPTRTLSPTPSITPTTIGPVTYPDNYNPLTGLPYPSVEARSRRNLIVKVSNYPEVVRPQSGLSFADIVWEYEVEGGVTRFAAIYRSQGTDVVGSVRSGRLLDLELVTIYDALFAYSGTNDNIKAMIGQATWKYRVMTPQFGDNCPPFCRFPKPGLPFEHTLFGNTYQMWDLATRRNVNQGTPARGMAFNTTPDDGGKTATDIYLRWSRRQDARWQYNPADGKYYRWNSGIPHIDALTGKQLSADNIILLQANHVDRPDIYESESGAVTLEIQLYESDKAWVFRDGQWFQGIWVRRARDKSGLSILYNDGKRAIMLKPGNSWVEVVRCCNMYGVQVSATPVDAQATETLAVQTATALAPAVQPAILTAQAPAFNETSTASAATAQRQPTKPAAAPENTPTADGPTNTPASVGMKP